MIHSIINPLVGVILMTALILGISIWGMAGWGGNAEEEGEDSAWIPPQTGLIDKVPPARPNPKRKTGTDNV